MSGGNVCYDHLGVNIRSRRSPAQFVVAYPSQSPGGGDKQQAFSISDPLGVMLQYANGQHYVSDGVCGQALDFTNMMISHFPLRFRVYPGITPFQAPLGKGLIIRDGLFY
jgi:hypothetical protein